jgi:hypothetical protein
MSIFKLRPTFSMELRESREVVIERLNTACRTMNAPHAFKMFGEYGEFHLPVEEHRLWSPHLSFYITEHAAPEDMRGNRQSKQQQSGGVSIVRGRFAPRLDVWTVVWIVYLLMAFTAFYGFALAYSQWMLNESAWGLWVACISLLIIGLVTGIAAVGQQLSSDQMLALRHQLEAQLRAAGVEVEESDGENISVNKSA